MHPLYSSTPQQHLSPLLPPDAGSTFTVTPVTPAHLGGVFPPAAGGTDMSEPEQEPEQPTLKPGQITAEPERVFNPIDLIKIEPPSPDSTTERVATVCTSRSRPSPAPLPRLDGTRRARYLGDGEGTPRGGSGRGVPDGGGMGPGLVTYGTRGRPLITIGFSYLRYAGMCRYIWRYVVMIIETLMKRLVIWLEAWF